MSGVYKMLILITGKPGSFKTAKCASLAIDYLKAGRRVFTNIAEFNYDSVEKLPENDDWTNTPTGSVVIYDEAQQFDFLQYKGREKLSTDHRVKELETHRHTGHDIILITQSPSFLHNHILSLVGEHYHLHRAYGRSYADVFLWRYTAHSPDSTGAKNKAESHTKFKPDTKIFDKYKSTELDTHKLKIPPLYFKLGGFLLAVIALVGFVVFGSDNPFLSASKIKENADIASGKQPQQTQLVGSQAASASIANQSNNLDFECRKAINVEKPECVQWFNDLSNNKGSVSGDFDKTLVTYNPSQPFNDSDIQKKLQYEVTSKPIFSGCMFKNGRYVAYTQQGTILNEVSQEDCKKLLVENDRPFNYFEKQDANSNSNSSNPNVHISDSNALRLATQNSMNYANNYVEPHLQQNSQVNGANTL